MKNFFVLLCVTAVCTTVAWGDDMTTLTGQTYTNFSVQQYDQVGYVVLHDGGRTNVPFTEINPELRGHYKALSMIPISRAHRGGEAEAPAGPDDLVTRAGQVYRNFTVKQIEENIIVISHNTGTDTVYFSSLPDEMQARVRAKPVTPDTPPGDRDIVTTYGVVFRNTEIIQEEPNGLTFRHDGGVTKLGFPALSEAIGEKHGYDPETAWKYGREMAAKKREALEVPEEEEAIGPPTFEIYAVETQLLPDEKFWVRFAVKNITDEPQRILIVPCEKKLRAIYSSKTLEIPPQSRKELQQFVIPNTAPVFLTANTDTYHTNVPLTWITAEEAPAQE